MPTARVDFVADAKSVEIEGRRAAYAVASTAKSMEASNVKMGAAAEAAAAKTAKAHEKMVASLKKTNSEFAKWGTAAGVGIVAVSADMAIKVEDAGAAIAKAGNTSLESGKRIEDAFRKIPGTVEYSAAKIGAAYATIAGELKVVHGQALTAAEATRVMNAALDLTDATGGDLTRTTESLGKVMMTFHLSAGEAAKTADVLFNSSKATGQSVEEFTTVVDRARGRLGALAPSLGDTAGLMVELAKQGVQGRLTMGALGGAFGTLLGKGKETERVLKDLNVHVFDSNGKFVGLRSVIDQLHKALKPYNEESQVAATKALFGEKANKQLLLVLHEGVPAYEAATKKATEHATAVSAAATEHKTLQGKLRATRADFENISATLGERFIPILQSVATAMDNTIKWFDKHQTAAKALAVVIGTVLGAAMVDFAVVKVAKFVGGLKTMASGMAWLAGQVVAKDAVIEDANAAAGESYSLLIPGAAVIAAVAVAGYELGKHWKEVTEGIEKVAQDMGNYVIGVLNELLHKASEAAGKLSFGLTPSLGHIGELSGAGEGGGGGGSGASWGHPPIGGSQKNVQGGIMGFFMSKGLTRAQAAGIVGNIELESGGDPNAPGGGLFQTIGGRGVPQGSSVLKQIESAWDEMIKRGEVAALKAIRTPHEAARYFETHFERPEGYNLPGEGGTAHSIQRERAANRAYLEHPGRERTSVAHAREQAGPEYGAEELAGPEHAAHHRRTAAARAEGYANPFAGASGLKRSRTDQGVDFSFSGALGAIGKGRIVNIISDPGGFGTEVVEELTDGPHKGQFIYYGLETGAILGISKGAHVHAGQKIATGRGTGGIELGFASSAGGVPISPYAPGESHEHPTAGGEAFSKFLASIGKTGTNLEVAGRVFSNAAKAAAKFVLSAAGQHAVVAAETDAAAAHMQATAYGGWASGQGSFLQAAQARWAKHPADLATAGGQAGAKLDDEQAVLTAKSQKKLYERELRALQKEAAGWAKARDVYRKAARHQPSPHAKKEALDKAAALDAKVEQAKAAAKELHGTITATEESISEAETTLHTQLPQEIAEAAEAQQGKDLGKYESAIGKVDAEVRAGIKTEAEGKAAKEAAATSALAGGYGPLSDEGTLKIKGDLREFSQATTEATDALKAHTEALEASTKVIGEFNAASSDLAHTETGVMSKALADLISGQIGGVAMQGRKLTAGAGTAARY